MLGRILYALFALIGLAATDSYLDDVLPFYADVKPHGTCNTFKTQLFGDRWCSPLPDMPTLPEPPALDTLDTLTNVSQAIVLVDARLRDHALLLRHGSQRLTGVDKKALQPLVSAASADLGAFRVTFDGVYHHIVAAMHKVHVTLSATNTSLTRLQDSFRDADGAAFRYHKERFAHQLNVLIAAVQPIPDMLSKTRHDAGFEQQKLMDVVASTERHKDTYWFQELRTRLGFLTTLTKVVEYAESSMDTLKHAETRLRQSYTRWLHVRRELNLFFNTDMDEYFKRMLLYPELKDAFQIELDEFVSAVQSELDFMNPNTNGSI